MAKKALIFLGSIALVAASFAGGLCVQREKQLIPLELSKALLPSFMGNDQEATPAPPLEEWRYPAAKKGSSSTSSSLKVNGKPVIFAQRLQAWTTPDAFEDVVRFYATKLFFDDPQGIAESFTGVGSMVVSRSGTVAETAEGDASPQTPAGESTYLTDDLDPEGGPQPTRRPLRSKCMTRQSPSYDITVFVTRGTGEKNTHIILLYAPKA